jgi:diadenosine tetraphosphatase ApaH/serine/threonine PP2A family protein phosphatase
LLVFGHTHKPWMREYGGVLFVNCRSVRRPNNGDARVAFAVLRSDQNEVLPGIERVAYDAERVARAVASSGLPREYAENLLVAA